MAVSYGCVVLQRFLIPLVLLLSALLRPVAISFVYLIMFFMSPFIPISTTKNVRSSVSAYFIILISISIILICCHIILQIVLTFIDMKDIGSFAEMLLRHIGFIDFSNLRVWAVIEWIIPEIIVLITAILTYVLIKKTTNKNALQLNVAGNVERGDQVSKEHYSRAFDGFNQIAPAFCLASIFFAGILRPSVLGGIYFLTFLAIATCWASYKKLKRAFAIVLRCLMVIMVFHTIFIVSYQTPWPQQHIGNDTLLARLLALEPLITTGCENDIRIICYNSWFKIDSFLAPVALLVAYQILALTSNVLLTKQISFGNNHSQDRSENIPLFQKKKKLSHIQMHNINRLDTNTELKSSIFDQISYGIISIAGFIYQNSFIFTNILMMTWSIVYHSWLTFVLLIWANVLWMIPNQRKAMMRSSIFIVVYAELLLIAHYLYGMNLNNDELPSKLKTAGINLEQIGLQRESQPSGNLIIKTIFTLMFWITLRQTYKEANEGRKSIDLTDPSQDRVVNLDDKKTSKFLKKAGDIIKSTLVRLWIWLLILVIFMCAITGQKMTGFRICYMALFLFFLLVFQISSKIWLKIMYGFWLFLIFYAMSILILIYTYQFDKFDEYWEKYLNLSKELQEDIGLQKFATKDLFLHLVSPTIIVILTVIQVHYFHKRLIASILSNSNYAMEQVEPVINTDGSETNVTNDNLNENGTTVMQKYSKITKLLNKLIKNVQMIFKNYAKRTKEIIWTFFELHLLKSIFLVAFISCVTEICVLHILFAILCVLGSISNQPVQVFVTRLISLLVSIIVLTKMIYQIGYFQHSKYDVVCENNITTNITQNNAVWFGLQKTSSDHSLVNIIKKYIIYIIMVTIDGVVHLRQHKKRKILLINKIPDVLFPNITRKDAEINLKRLIAYLFNYGYYKFGLEITLIILVAVITHRLDIISVLYSVWLCIIIFLDRSKCAIIWPIFQWFTAVLIILQFIFLVNIPPGLCIKNIWEGSEYSEGLQAWALLPGEFNYDHAYKLIFDFVLLLCISRQTKVFILEKTNDYPGGSNNLIIEDIEVLGSKSFENTTTDFLSKVRNWLDIIKNLVLCGFYWITLAIVFLAGTHSTDVFAIGYFIGSFIFLWQGTDFYLRPIRHILNRWNILLFFNVATIVCKTILQLASCLFMTPLENNACWLVHLFELSCEQKHKNDNNINIEDNSLKCPPITSNSALIWDAICFSFLIFQLRIFKSYYFCHIINSTKASTILASRGAELIEDLRKNQIEHRKQHEQTVLRKIKKKMEKIRSTQQKIAIPTKNPIHADGIDERAPIAESIESSNITSCQGTGYHTPIENNIEVQDEIIDLPYNHAISPSSIGMTISLDDYLESKKLYLETPSDIDIWTDKYSIDSTPIFSSIPGVQSNVGAIQPLNVNRRHRRQSSGNTVSWNEPAIENIKPKIDISSTDFEDPNSLLRQRSFHKKNFNIMNSFYGLNEKLNMLSVKRRFSNISYKPDDNLSPRALNVRRPYSWGPIDNIVLLDSLASEASNTTTTHGESIRAGDYYMFVDVDEKFELDLINDEENFLEDTEHFTQDKRKKSDREETATGTFSTELKDNIIEIPQDEIKIDEISSSKSDEDVSTSSSKNTITNLIREFLMKLILKLNTYSRNYRYVMKILGEEKKVLKESKDFERRVRTGTAQIWTPFMYFRKHIQSKDTEFDSSVAMKEPNELINEDEFTTRKHHMCIEVLISAWYALLSNTDVICYLVVFLNQVVNASIISIPLPILVFVWGTLSLPRPTKTFWVTLIAYTECLVLIKCIFQFKLIWSNYVNLPNQPLSAAKIIGLELKNHYANFDLLLLLFLFFHRFVLKSQGLWNSEANDVAEEGNLIYTEAENQENFPSTSAQLMQKNVSTNIEDENNLITNEDDDISDLSKIKMEDLETKYIPGLSKISSAKYFSSMRTFFHNLVHKVRLPTDVYAVMFLCDFINFFVLLFGFTAFGSQQNDGGGVQTYLQENKVPIPFLIMLLVQFILIVIDRALYLSKALVYKIIFHYFSVIGIHIWMFFVIPAVTERNFNSLTPPVVFYIIKCIYLLLSSYQIKCGYPKRILGNFLTKGFSLINMISFKIYMLIPFLYELRTLLDWVCTDTTMTLFDWLKMEDIFSNIFFIKCTRQLEKDFPAVRAIKKPMYTKILLGGSVILIIVISIWGPLCLFALGNAVGQSNIPYAATVSIRIGSFEPIYKINNRESIYPFKIENLIALQNLYGKERNAITFITNYDESDIAAMVFSGNAPSLWNISPPDKEQLLKDLISNATLGLRFEYSISRVPPNKNSQGTISNEITYDIGVEGRNSMIAMLQGNTSAESIVVPNVVPKFIKVLNSDDMIEISQLLPQNIVHRPLHLKLYVDKDDSKEIWWEVKEDCLDNIYNKTLSQWPYSQCDSGMVLYTFNDKKFPSTFSFITAGGIIGLYTTFVLLASRFMKSFISGLCRQIMFEDLPYVDRVLQICLDIYLVREALEFALEEDLFAKLIFLYRSPETMIKWTRPKEESKDDSVSEAPNLSTRSVN